MKKRILLVEDNKDLQLCVSEMIGLLGYDCDLANDGKAAIDLTKDNTYDLILMDIQMPTMNGIEASSLLRREGDETPIIGLSAHAGFEYMSEAKSVGMSEYVIKPLRFDDLERIFKAYVE